MKELTWPISFSNPVTIRSPAMFDASNWPRDLPSLRRPHHVTRVTCSPSHRFRDSTPDQQTKLDVHCTSGLTNMANHRHQIYLPPRSVSELRHTSPDYPLLFAHPPSTLTLTCSPSTAPAHSQTSNTSSKSTEEGKSRLHQLPSQGKQ